MGCRDASAPSGGAYRPRNPRASPLYHCVARHAGELRAAGRLERSVEARTIDRFVECGDPHFGFARVRCDTCGHDYLLSFSCKTRNFCPSCHQKRGLLYGEWVEENVLAPVAHRQYVFTVPRLLRPLFSRRRAWLGELCRIAARVLEKACRVAVPGAKPACIEFVQTFGDLVNFHPHVHVLAAELGEETGFSFEPRAVSGSVAREIARAAADFDLVVIGAYGMHPLRDFAIGTSAERLLRRSHRPVLVVNRKPAGPYRQVLVPVDFSPDARAAVSLARQVAPDAELHLLHAFEVAFESKLRFAGVEDEEISVATVRRRGRRRWRAWNG